MCTRILWNDNGLAVLVGRTMDWPTTTEPTYVVFPRGQRRDGGKVGPDQLISDRPLIWESKYGSVVISLYGLGSADGMNEAGLSIHAHYFDEADFGERDPAIPGIQAGLWGQYLLDNAASVAEALPLLDGVQFVMAASHGRESRLHLGIEDASGDSAIIEYVEGEPRIYHDRRFVMMTNSPGYDEQLQFLAEQDFSNPSSDMPLPGNVNPRDRFQRGAYYRAMLPEPQSEREAVASLLSVVRNVSVPYGAPYKGMGIYNTEYRTVINNTGRRYYFELTNSPSLVWVDLNKLDFSEGAPVLMLDPDNIDLCGDVTSELQPADAPF